MIVIRLSGGMGNQMFQFAAGLNIAIRNRTKLVLDDHLFKAFPLNPKYTKRNFELGCFSIQKHVFIKDIFKILPYRGLLYGLFAQVKIKFKRLYVYNEGQQSFNPAVLEIPSNTYLVGVFQSELYFYEIADIIRKVFNFNFNLNFSEKNRVIYQLISTTTSVSIHIRRTDFVSDSNIDIHGACSLDYYYRAIKSINNIYTNPTYFIFSDDFDWVKKNILIDKYVFYYVEGNKWDKSYMDMFLMSKCLHNIIANSSFSWWGAWLNDNMQKTVIAPKEWYANKCIDKSKLLPIDWIQI